MEIDVLLPEVLKPTFYEHGLATATSMPYGMPCLSIPRIFREVAWTHKLS